MANTDLLDYAGLGYYDGKIKAWTVSDAAVTAAGSTAGRTLPAHFADIVNVKDFGAKGDGTTDDTAAIQAALTAGKGKTIFFPAGTYIITDTPTLSGSAANSTTCIGYGATIALQSYMPDDQTISTGISGLRFVGASNVTIRGLKFHKVWHGIDVFYSMTASDYPATENGNIHDIRIENCEFDTSQWAISAVGIYGFTVSNCAINQNRLNMPEGWDDYSNRDGVHTLGCVNVIIDNIVGASDDDFIAIGCGEKYLFSSRTFYGVCQNYVITNCVMNNNLNGFSDSGARSFVGFWGESLTGELAEKYRFSVDNIQISNCCVETDIGCLLRNTGASAAVQALAVKYVGRITVSNTLHNRPFMNENAADISSISSSAGWDVSLQQGVDELVFENCRFTVDPRWTSEDFEVGVARIGNELRRLVFRNCSVVSTRAGIVINDNATSSITPETRSKIESIDISGCDFTTYETGTGGVILVLARRAAARVSFSDTTVSGLFRRPLQMMDNASIDDLYLDGIEGVSSVTLVRANTTQCVISRTHASRLSGSAAIIDNSETQTSPADFLVIGDFSCSRPPFSRNTSYAKAHGVNLADSTWCTGSASGSLAIVNGSLSVMASGAWKAVALQ